MLIDPLPLVNKVFSYLQQQERQRQIAFNSPSLDSIALATRNTFKNFRGSNTPSFAAKKDRPYCTHCKIASHVFVNFFKAGNAQIPICTHFEMAGHTADRCYKLHGYPPGEKLQNKLWNNAVLTPQTSIPTNPEVDSENNVSLTRE